MKVKESPSRVATDRTFDFDLHGLVGVRLVDATERDIAAVGRQLGPIAKPLTRPPDIVLRFVDRVEDKSPLHLLGLDDAGYTDDGFVVLRAKHKSRTKVRLPLQNIGGDMEIVCERGLAAVPLLIAVVNLTALAKGYLPLHASAFLHEGTGVVTTGWSKGGKTEALLTFMLNGARYVGDEWVYFSADGQQMFGIPEPIRVWKWYLDQSSQLMDKVGRTQRLRLGLVGTVLNGIGAATANGARHGGLSRNLNRIKPLLTKQMCVDLPPEQLFQQDRCAMSGNVDRIFLVTSHESSKTYVREVDPLLVADRMVFSLQEELANFMAYYHKFRFAFPHAANEIVDGSASLQRAALETLLAGRQTYEVLHPYPAVLQDLYDAMQPYVSGDNAISGTER